MNVLGITASFSLEHEKTILVGETFGLGHDSSAAMICQGRVSSAIEEERLNRIKHTNKAPVNAVRACLVNAACTIDDVDFFALNFKKDTIDLNIKKSELDFKKKLMSVEEYINRIFIQSLGKEINTKKIVYVPHHIAHAESTFLLSGFDEALVVILDGVGDNSSGIIQYRNGNEVKLLDTISIENSLGFFYLNLIKYLGYNIHDEYKVMGLAPYGNHKKYEKIFNKMYTLLPKGKYTINSTAYNLLFGLELPRFRSEEFLQLHMDVAASIQHSLECIIIHVVSYYANLTHAKNLCMAGGVAHNCSVTGKLIKSNIFHNIFVQPAASDAGTSLGAALYVYKTKTNAKANFKVNHVFWGNSIGDNDKVKTVLENWKPFLDYQLTENVSRDVAKAISEGSVVGWVQGRSEFGPRALGNRSILADPRKGENRSIINNMIKKRESYRPFAPSILLEDAEEFFDIINKDVELGFMNFTVNVKEDKRVQLQAITHVDGTGRIQTVNKDTNLKFWELIHEFKKITGVPIVLNTSFNNFAEPIVDSIEDAIVTYLTTNLPLLAINDYIIRKRDYSVDDFCSLFIKIKKSSYLQNEYTFIGDGIIKKKYFICRNYNDLSRYEISEILYQKLSQLNTTSQINMIFSHTEIAETETVKEIKMLWENRLIDLSVDK